MSTHEGNTRFNNIGHFVASTTEENIQSHCAISCLFFEGEDPCFTNGRHFVQRLAILAFESFKPCDGHLKDPRDGSVFAGFRCDGRITHRGF